MNIRDAAKIAESIQIVRAGETWCMVVANDNSPNALVIETARGSPKTYKSLDRLIEALREADFKGTVKLPMMTLDQRGLEL